MNMLFPFVTLSTLTIIVTNAHPEDTHGICANVKSIYRQCAITDNGIAMKGKAGPKGDKGEKGAPAILDYSHISNIVQEKIDSAMAGIQQKLDECKLLNDQQLTEISKIKDKLASVYGTDCKTIKPEDFISGNSSAGIYQINVAKAKLQVYCDLNTDGGGWTVIQRRMNGSVDFFRDHIEYVNGFGDISGEFWIGLDNIYNIMLGKSFELRIDMEDWSGVKKFAKYSQFSIGKPLKDYILLASGYSGDAGDSFSGQSNVGFSTKDHDVDIYSSNCAQSFKGAWWYTNCHGSNLNGFYHQGGPHDSYADGVNWSAWKGYHYSLKFVEMKIRPISF